MVEAKIIFVKQFSSFIILGETVWSVVHTHTHAILLAEGALELRKVFVL